MVVGFGHVHPCPRVVHTDASVDFIRRGPVRRLGKARDGDESGRRCARRVASAVDVDRIRGGSWALEVAGVLRVASAVVADQIRVGSWAHEEAKSRRGEAERDGETSRLTAANGVVRTSRRARSR